MKKMFNKMSNTVKTMTCKAHCAMTCARAHLSAPLCNTRGEGYIDTAIKILIAVVLGALLLAGLYTLFGDTVLPTVTERVEEMFDYADKQELEESIIRRHYGTIVMDSEQPQGGGTSAGGMAQGIQAAPDSRKTVFRP